MPFIQISTAENSLHQIVRALLTEYTIHNHRTPICWLSSFCRIAIARARKPFENCAKKTKISALSSSLTQLRLR